MIEEISPYILWIVMIGVMINQFIVFRSFSREIFELEANESHSDDLVQKRRAIIKKHKIRSLFGIGILIICFFLLAILRDLFS